LPRFGSSVVVSTRGAVICARAKAVGFLRQLLSFSLLAWAFFYADVLEIEAIFSKRTQAAGLTICELPSIIGSVKNDLLALKGDLCTGAHTKAFFSQLDGASFCAYGIALDQSKEQFETEAKQYLQALHDSVSVRFPATSLFQAASIFDPTYVPGEKDTAFINYGVEQLTTLLAHFGTDVNEHDVRNQWPLLKQLYSQHFRSFSARETWRRLLTNEAWSRKLGAIFKLLRMLMCIHATSVGPERDHRERTNTKTCNRSMLTNKSLNELMMVGALSRMSVICFNRSRKTAHRFQSMIQSLPLMHGLRLDRSTLMVMPRGFVWVLLRVCQCVVV
jgi:hypothetical protein